MSDHENNGLVKFGTAYVDPTIVQAICYSPDDQSVCVMLASGSALEYSMTPEIRSEAAKLHAAVDFYVLQRIRSQTRMN